MENASLMSEEMEVVPIHLGYARNQVTTLVLSENDRGIRGPSFNQTSAAKASPGITRKAFKPLPTSILLDFRFLSRSHHSLSPESP